MYNAELKDRFARQFSTKLSMREACAVLFQMTEPYELGWGGDICTQSAETLRPVVESLVGLRGKSHYLRVSILRSYVQWCIEQKVPGACDGMLQVETKAIGMDRMRRETVRNPMHLQRYLDALFFPVEEQQYDSTLRCYLWLAYMGVADADTLRITADDVDFGNMVVRLDGREYPIYRESLQTIKNCAELTQFRNMQVTNGERKQMWRNRIPGKAILRGIRAEPTIHGFRSMIARRATVAIEEGKTDLRLTYRHIQLSGIFYRMYEREMAGFTPDFNGVAAEFMDGREYRLESGRNTRAAKRRQLASQYLSDYNRWKAVMWL